MIRAGWLAAATVLGYLLWAPPAAHAQPYGAIAYDGKTGAWGASYNQGTQDTANTRAIGECRKHTKECDVVVRFWGELCAAYATGGGKAAGWGTGETQQVAQRRAIAACNTQGRDCAARVWSCNTRGGGNEAFEPTRKCHYWDPVSQAYVTRFCSSTR